MQFELFNFSHNSQVRHSGSVAAVESVVEPVSLVKEEGEGGRVPVTKHGGSDNFIVANCFFFCIFENKLSC